MSRTWEQYSQTSQSMVVADPSAVPQGLSSDAVELQRAGLVGSDVDFDEISRVIGAANGLFGEERTIGTD